MDKVFPRVPWMLQPYADLLSTTIDDLLQVDTGTGEFPPPLYASRSQYDASRGLVKCAWAAGHPTRQEAPVIPKRELIALAGGEVYFERDGFPGKVVLHVDDELKYGTGGYGLWKTVSLLQERLYPDTVLGGDPDRIIGYLADLQSIGRHADLLICDHNLGWKEGDGHPEFRHGPDFVGYIRGAGFHVPPIILHSDVAMFPHRWEEVEGYRLFVPKYDEGTRPHMDILVDASRRILGE